MLEGCTPLYKRVDLTFLYNNTIARLISRQNHSEELRPSWIFASASMPLKTYQDRHSQNSKCLSAGPRLCADSNLKPDIYYSFLMSSINNSILRSGMTPLRVTIRTEPKVTADTSRFSEKFMINRLELVRTSVGYP